MSEVPTMVGETAAPAVEHTPVFEATDAPAADAITEPSATTMPSEATATIVGGEVVPVPATEETLKGDKSEVAIEATPASEGVLGYKAPSLIPKFRFADHFFWFEDAAASSESLAGYVRGKEIKEAHNNASWAQETGKGLLFYTKRAEDRSSPAGIINLSEASPVTTEGSREFFFKAHGHKHVFQAAHHSERSSWVVALEKKIEEAKAMKEDIHGSEGYKSHMESFAKAPAMAAAVPHKTSTSRGPRKSLDAATVTNGVTKDKEVATTGATTAVTEEPKVKDTKSRSQSRKRDSMFGLFGKKETKDDQKDLIKEEKAEEKAEETAEKEEEKEAVKEEKAEEKLEKEHEVEAGAAGVAVPAAVVAAEEKKHEDGTPVNKKTKRASVFGSLFGKKDVTSPTTEKSEKDVGPSVPAKDADVLPVAENAPVIEEPFANKPIDTAAVTAPVDTVQTPVATEEATKEAATTETATTPTKEKKSGLMGYLKKAEAMLEGKKAEKTEEKAAEDISKDPVAAAAVDTPATTTETTVPSSDEARPVIADKRRSSLFSSLGTMKKRGNNTETATEADAVSGEKKREKSPLPQKIGGLFRKPSKAVKSEEKKDSTAAATESTPTDSTPAPISKDESELTNGTSTSEQPLAIAGDVAPNGVHSTFHDAVTNAPEVQASA